jgi:Ser/Thr protein kinase RdoA (MazF antagonist)
MSASSAHGILLYVRLRPVMTSTATVVDTASEAQGQQLSFTGELDVDVYRLRRSDTEPDLVARVFGPGVQRTAVETAAQVLHKLADTPFPAERCPTRTPVLPIRDGGHMLLTEYVEPSPAPSRAFVLAWCAALLGRLATRAGDNLAAGGGWHRLGASPTDEIDEALRLGTHVGPSVAEVMDTLAEADDGTGLPEALIHADLTPPNAIPQGSQPPVVIDWIGVGRGPRVWPLAFLLFAAGPRAAGRALDRYTRSVSLTDEERHRLPGIMMARPLTLDLWSVAYDRLTPQQAITRCRAHRARIEAIATALNHPGQP